MNIVKKITEDMDRKKIDCSTYQMRNFFTQLGDGFFQPIDIMNYIQHYKIVKLIKKHDIVVDMCCGRSLLCPFIKYHKKDIGEYIGVDICQDNINEAKRLEEKKHGYSFLHKWININVIEMSNYISSNSVDMVVYTSSIEHMQPEWGEKSLEEAYKILKPNGTFILSFPNTIGDGYNVQYKAAHVYEWSYQNIISALNKTGFTIEKSYGIFLPITEIKKLMEQKYPELLPFLNQIQEYIPNEFLSSIFSVPFPQESRETLVICKKSSETSLFED